MRKCKIAVARGQQDERSTSHALLAEPKAHSCAADASCTAHPDCCTGGAADACGVCIATRMHAELQDAPPALTADEAQAKAQGVAEGEAKGKTEGALMGAGVAVACMAAAQLLWNSAQRRRTQREARSLEIAAPAQAL